MCWNRGKRVAELGSESRQTRRDGWAVGGWFACCDPRGKVGLASALLADYHQENREGDCFG